MTLLKFDAEGFFKAYCEELQKASQEAMQSFFNYAKGKIKADDFEVLETAVNSACTHIQTQCVFYAQSIMESFGTGSSMSIANADLAEYMSSEYWNPLRQGFFIVGRPEGEYTNIFGEKVYSSGTMAGQIIEAKVPPKAPKYGIQQAEQRLKQGINGGFVDRIIEQHTTEFITTRASDFFYNVKE